MSAFISVSNMSRVCLDSNDCKQCGRVLAEIEHIDDEADSAGIKFVKIDDKQLSKQYGVFALPAILFFKMGSKEPVIYAGTRRTTRIFYHRNRSKLKRFI